MDDRDDPRPALATIAIPALAGVLFGVGLLLSGMSDPAKVLAFLDLAGNWDPSLALVMGGAIAFALPPFAYAAGRQKTLIGSPLSWPADRGIDRRLVAGAALFGIGWGLVGLCPGPALLTLAAGWLPALVFTATMILGMLIAGCIGEFDKACE